MVGQWFGAITGAPESGAPYNRTKIARKSLSALTLDPVQKMKTP